MGKNELDKPANLFTKRKLINTLLQKATREGDSALVLRSAGTVYICTVNSKAEEAVIVHSDRARSHSKSLYLVVYQVTKKRDKLDPYDVNKTEGLLHSSNFNPEETSGGSNISEGEVRRLIREIDSSDPF